MLGHFNRSVNMHACTCIMDAVIPKGCKYPIHYVGVGVTRTARHGQQSFLPFFPSLPLLGINRLGSEGEDEKIRCSASQLHTIFGFTPDLPTRLSLLFRMYL